MHPNNQSCAICDNKPQDLLVLVCGHNLCVNCATEIYTLNGRVNPFACEICLVETELDEDTIGYFREATERRDSKRDRKEKPSRPPKARSPQKNPHPQQPLCKTHNEPTLYYCHNCNTTDICSECILTPKHNTHRVVTLKKAYHNLQKRIDEEIGACELVRGQLVEQKELIAIRKMECQKIFGAKKEEIKEVFDEIARAVSDRYSALCIQIEQQCTRSLQIYDAYLVQANQKLKLVQQSVKYQKKAQQTPTESILIDLMSGLPDSKTLFAPTPPRDLPACNIQLGNSETLCFEISALLNKYGWQKYEEQQPAEYSIIPQENGLEQAGRTALKQSHKVSMNANVHNNSRTQNRISSSRKLDLSRSLENATYIINRLQQRSKIG